MRKTTKKNAAKASQQRARKDLDVKPAKGGTVRGGDKAVKVTLHDISFTHNIDGSTP